MKKDDIISALVHLGSKMGDSLKDDQGLFEMAYLKNNWFTRANIELCFQSWIDLLKEDSLISWSKGVNYANEPKIVGLVLAGNLPLVGLHDLVSVLITGHSAKLKLSSDDSVLMQWVIDVICSFNPIIQKRIVKAERIKEIDAVIATGSNNTSRYFEYYFKDIPSIIRKNRTGIAVLKGDESSENLRSLGKDIFSYFGLGCRNVSKIYIPQNYNFTKFIEANLDYEELVNHNKYANNYTYHKSIFLMNGTVHLDTGFLLLKEDENLHAPLGCAFYQHYKDLDKLVDKLNTQKEEIQCVVSDGTFPGSIGFGETQNPALNTYADGVDTLAFLGRI